MYRMFATFSNQVYNIHVALIMPCFFVVQLTGIFSRFSERYLVLPSGNLQIHAARRHDQGEYRCVVTNSVSGERRASPRSVRLQVTREYKTKPPNFNLIFTNMSEAHCATPAHIRTINLPHSHTFQVQPLRFSHSRSAADFHNFRELISYCVTHDSAKSEMTSLKCQLDNHDTVLIFFHENRKKVAG